MSAVGPSDGLLSFAVNGIIGPEKNLFHQNPENKIPQTCQVLHLGDKEFTFGLQNCREDLISSARRKVIP